jgi:predicted ATPase/DNA-binding CsgD family transcriptional regulator
VLLDNCEHLAPACAGFIESLLVRNPGVVVLLTSREPLGVPGEVVCRVPSLSTPIPAPSVAVDALSQYDAVRLFADRAHRARPSFVVNEDTAPAIAQICFQLDGIPLALELAAARCRHLSVDRIARDLDDRFRLLTGGARTVLPRQQTLGASIDWSHDRLDATEQRVFRRLGVFVGPVPLEAIEAIAGFDGVEEHEVFDVITRLCDKSLVQVVESPVGEPCYRLLETLRVYAASRARDAAELALLQAAHAAWWLAWLDAREGELHTDPVVDQVEEYRDNLKAALAWGVDHPDVGLRLLRRVARPWQNSALAADVIPFVDRLLTDENAAAYPLAWARAANTVAVLVNTARGEGAATWLLEKAEQLALDGGDELHAALARWLRGYTVERCMEVRELAHAEGQRYVEALATIALAQVHIDSEPATALALIDSPASTAAARESSYLRDFAWRTRAAAYGSAGALHECIELARELASSRSTLMVNSAVHALSGAGLLARDEATLTFAIEVAERRLRHIQGTAETAERAVAWRHLLDGAPSALDRDLAMHCAGQSTALTHIFLREALDAGGRDLVREVLGSQDRSMPFRQAVAAAITARVDDDEDEWHEALRLADAHGFRLLVVDALEGLACAAATAESWVECLRLLGAAARLREEAGYRWRFPSEDDAFETASGAATNALGAESADVAIREGHDLGRDAVAYAQRARGERKRPRHGWDSLTPTEEQVVALVAQGLTNPQIAERMLIARSTVKTHLDHVFAKLGVASRAELAARAARNEA